MYTMHVEMSYFFSYVQSLLFFFYFFTHSGLLRKSKRKHTFTFTHSYVTDAYNPDEIILRRHFDIYLTQEHTGEWEIVSVGHLPFDVYIQPLCMHALLCFALASCVTFISGNSPHSELMFIILSELNSMMHYNRLASCHFEWIGCSIFAHWFSQYICIARNQWVRAEQTTCNAIWKSAWTDWIFIEGIRSKSFFAHIVQSKNYAARNVQAT